MIPPFIWLRVWLRVWLYVWFYLALCLAPEAVLHPARVRAASLVTFTFVRPECPSGILRSISEKGGLV